MNIYEKLLKVREGFSAAKISKSGTNKYAGFSYFELSDIIPTITKLCADVKALPLINYNGETATLKFINAEKPDELIEISCEMREGGAKGMNPAQAYGSMQTYTRRYLYLTLFDIVEPDGIDAAPQKEQRAAMPPVAEQQPQPQAQPKKKLKPGKLNQQNRAMMNKLILAYAERSGMSAKETTKNIEEWSGIKMQDLTDDQAPEIFGMLEQLIKEASAEEQEPA